jgi:hypothetical protein
MSVSDTLYQARVETVEMLERAKDAVLRQPVYDAGALVAPTAIGSTCTVYNSNNVVVVSPTVSVVSSVATATVTAATLPVTLTLGEGWRVEWQLLMPDGTTRLVRRDAALVRTRLLPPAGWPDVFRREPGLDPSTAHPIHALTLAELDPYLDEAWVQLEGRLIAAGRRPWLVISPQALREVLILSVLALVYQSFVTRLKPAYQEIAAQYAAQRELAWSQVRLVYDADDDGAADGGDTPEQVGGQTSVWLGTFGAQSAPWRWS